MGYGRTSYRGGSRSTRPVTAGRVARVNARPGPCRGCGEEIPAGAGNLWRESGGAWSVVHTVAEWAGSPVSGQYAGGCPAETDAMNERGKFGGPDGARSEVERIAAVAATYAATHAVIEAPRRRSYASTSSGARMYERCGHEDYPCCGCGE
jgi:hypothetical protein